MKTITVKPTAILATVLIATMHMVSAISPAFAQKTDLKPLLDLKLKDLSGKPFDSDKLKGKILVVDFWAVWCGPCVSEIPELNELQKEYANKGVQVVGVTMASGEPAEVKPFVDKHNMKYSVLLGDDDQTYDLNLVGYPTTLLVTKDWKIFKTYIGSGPQKIKMMEADINKLLSGPPLEARAN
jgi:thiol-disulfide isomerase/thioredoxin